MKSGLPFRFPEMSPGPYPGPARRPSNSQIAASTASGVAGASSRSAASGPAAAATASRMASQTEIESISGGSPTALERKIVGSRLGASSRICTLNTGGTSRLPGIL